MFAPGECASAAIACPVIAYLVATGVYHDSRTASLVFAGFVCAVIACFGAAGPPRPLLVLGGLLLAVAGLAFVGG